MIRRIRTALLVLIFALLGTVAGRAAATTRRQLEAGEAFHLDRSEVFPGRIPEVIPGIVAAMRVNERPWSYLHIPPWLAAFCVNFALVAMARELRPIMRTIAGGGGGDWWATTDEPESRDASTPEREGSAAEGRPEGFTPFPD